MAALHRRSPAAPGHRRRPLLDSRRERHHDRVGQRLRDRSDEAHQEAEPRASRRRRRHRSRAARRSPSRTTTAPARRRRRRRSRRRRATLGRHVRRRAAHEPSWVMVEAPGASRAMPKSAEPLRARSATCSPPRMSRCTPRRGRAITPTATAFNSRAPRARWRRAPGGREDRRAAPSRGRGGRRQRAGAEYLDHARVRTCGSGGLAEESRLLPLGPEQLTRSTLSATSAVCSCAA